LEICTGAFPVLVIATCCVELLPIPTLPKLRLVELAVNRPVAAVVPCPVKSTASVGFVGSLLMIERLPLAAPAVVGENVTVSGADCPALIVFGVVIPVIPKALPVTVIMDTIRSLEPALFNIRFAVPFRPFDTAPKSMEAGVTDNCG